MSIMTLAKRLLFVLTLSFMTGAQAALPPQLAPPLDGLTIYSGAAITMGASSMVGGNIMVEAAATLGASTIVGGYIVSGAAVTLGATASVGGYIEARNAGTIGADSTIGGYLTTGDAATLGANTIDGNIMVDGNLTAGAAILVGTEAVITGNLRSGAAASADLGADAIVGGNAAAGTALTLGADVVVSGHAQAGTGAVALGVDAVVAGNARAGTNVTLAAGASVGGDITPGSIEQFTNDPKEPIDDQSPQLSQLQAELAAMIAPAANQLPTAMTINTTLEPGIYHATAMTTTAGITVTFYGDGTGVNSHWLINSDSFLAFGASTIIELKNTGPKSTITWNSGSYIEVGASAKLMGTFFAGSYILTGASTTLERTGGVCGGLFTNTGAVTLGASNIIGAYDCTSSLVEPDHFSIEHDGTAINCLAEKITISAHTADHDALATNYTGTISLSTDTISSSSSTNNGDWSGGKVANLSNEGNGQATYTFDDTEEGSVILYLANSVAETIDINVEDPISGLSEKSGKADDNEDPLLEYKAAGFIFHDGTIERNDIVKQTAGITANLVLEAVITNTTTGACDAALIGDNDIMVGFECLNPSTCQRPLSLGSNSASMTIIPIGASNTVNYAPVALDFGLVDDSTAYVFMNYSDAGAIRLHAEHTFENGTIISGISNSFVVKPHSYLITLSDGETGSDYEANSATDSIYKKAGEPFTVTVTARSFDESTTPNFGNESSPSVTVDLNRLLARPNNVDDGFTGVPGMLNGTWSNHIDNSGRFSGDYSFNEVGIIDLTASIDYLGTGTVKTTLSSIGRFTPASLLLTVINDGTFISANTDGALNFTYVGQPFSYDPADRPSLRVTALNASSPATLTSNYSGAWGKLNADSIELTKPTSDEIQHGTLKPDGTSTRMALTYVQDPEGFRDPTITANPPAAVNGIFDAAFTNDQFTYDKDSNSQISPFTPNVNLIITKVTDADEISTGSITLKPTGSEPIRFGRMRMDSAHGSELKLLEMAYRLEYFDSPDWLLHDDENSTITADDISSDPTGISATSIKQTTPEGKFYITLSPPGLENNGPYKITTDVLGSEEPWLQYDWENDDNFDDNPRSTATFGIYKGNSHQIFSRQAFQ
jgi:predicted acyltransferase (DUF342 family)